MLMSGVEDNAETNRCSLKTKNEFNYNANYYNTLNENWTEISLPVISSEVGKLLDHYSPRNILDYGAGAGAYAEVLSARGAQVTACDINPQSLHVCQAKRRCHDVFLLKTDGSLGALEQYDMIFSSEVLEHIEKCESTVADWYKALKPGGIVYLTTTKYGPSIFTMLYAAQECGLGAKQILCECFLWMKGYWCLEARRKFILKWCYESLGGHYHGFRSSELRAMFRKCGFERIRTRPLYILPPLQISFLYSGSSLSLFRKTEWSFCKRTICWFVRMLSKPLNGTCKFSGILANNVLLVAVKPQDGLQK